MKHSFHIALLLVCLLAFGCSAGQTSQESVEPAGLWNLGNRYPSTYGTLRHAYTYEKNGETFYLTVARNKKESGKTANILSSETQNERTYSLIKSEKTDSETNAYYTYYECLTGAFRYFIGKDEPDFRAEALLTMSEAIRLTDQPDAPIEGLTLCGEEWSAYYRLDACNLEISVFPSDNGNAYSALTDSCEERTEDGEPYLFSEAEQMICYTNGTDTVKITQIDRSGKKHTAYNTRSECKAVLALLGNNQED